MAVLAHRRAHERHASAAFDLAAPSALSRPGWFDLAANECPNDCPIDTISRKNSMCSRTSCLDAACLARSASILHASNLVVT